MRTVFKKQSQLGDSARARKNRNIGGRTQLNIKNCRPVKRGEHGYWLLGQQVEHCIVVDFDKCCIDQEFFIGPVIIAIIIINYSRERSEREVNKKEWFSFDFHEDFYLLQVGVGKRVRSSYPLRSSI